MTERHHCGPCNLLYDGMDCPRCDTADQWRYMDCDYAASGSAVLALGSETGHFGMPIAMCQDNDLAQHIAAILKLRGRK